MYRRRISCSYDHHFSGGLISESRGFCCKIVNPVAAGLLGAVQGPVGLLQQVLRDRFCNSIDASLQTLSLIHI